MRSGLRRQNWSLFISGKRIIPDYKRVSCIALYILQCSKPFKGDKCISYNNRYIKYKVKNYIQVDSDGVYMYILSHIYYFYLEQRNGSLLS